MPRKVTPFDNASLPRESGIYCIACTANGKIYIGSSVNIRKRVARHSKHLQRQTHDNNHLQNAWNAYGSETFNVSVLELCGTSELVTREQHYLDTLQPFDDRGFNIMRRAELPFLGVVLPAETRAKISAKAKGRPVSPETRAKLSTALSGRPKSAEFRAKISEANKRHVISPEGRLRISAAHKGKVMSPETRAKMSKSGKGRPKSATHRAKIGKANTLRTLSDKTRERIGAANSKTYIVTAPDGTRFKVVNLSAFCKANGLCDSSMNGVARGKQRHHKGWRCEYA